MSIVINKIYNIHLRSQCYIIWKHTKETKIKTEEHINRQNVNTCIRNWDANKDRKKTIEHFWKEIV